jgi:hypothetical protein
MNLQETQVFVAILAKYFDSHPVTDLFYFTADGIGFFASNIAEANAKNLDDKTIVSVTRAQYNEAKIHLRGIELQAKNGTVENPEKTDEEKVLDDVGVEDTNNPVDYNTWTIASLKAELAKRNIPFEAKTLKSALVALLEQGDNLAADQAETVVQ